MPFEYDNMAVILMNLLFLLTTAFSVSADSFFLGLSLSKTSKKHFLTVTGVCLSVLTLCLLGSFLGEIFGEFLKNYSKFLSGFILLLVGVLGLFSKPKSKEIYKDGNHFMKSIFLGFSVGLDGAVGSFTLTCSGYKGVLVALIITFIHVLLLIIAVLLNKTLTKKIPENSKFPSILLIVLGLYKLIF